MQMLFNRRHLLILAVALVGLVAYRVLFAEPLPTSDQLAARAGEIDHVWNRIEPYPGTSLADAQVEKQVTDAAVVSIHRWQTDALWPAVRAHFEQVLPDAAWYKLGETTSDSGAPMLLFRQPPYHMIVILQDGLMELRATWTTTGSPLVE